MTDLNAFRKEELKRFHLLLAMYLQYGDQKKDIPESMLKQLGWTVSNLEALFEEEDARGMDGLQSIVRTIMSVSSRGRKIGLRKEKHLDKPLYIYDFGDDKRTNIDRIYIGIKPEKSWMRKLVEWATAGRGMEYARGTVIIKDPDSPSRPKDVPDVDLQILRERNPKAYREYKDRYLDRWEGYAKKYGRANREAAKRFVMGVMESKFQVVEANPSHLILGKDLLTATSYAHTYVPHHFLMPRDLTDRDCEIQQHTYRFQNPDAAKKFMDDLRHGGKPQLSLNERFVRHLSQNIMPFDDVLLLKEGPESQCLMVRDKDLVMEVIAPAIRRYSEIFENQMYYTAKVAMLKKDDHLVTFDANEDAISYYNSRLGIPGAGFEKVTWLPRGSEGTGIVIGNCKYLVIRMGNEILETEYTDMKKERERLTKEYDLYRKGAAGKKGSVKHYLDKISPNPTDLSLGWFAHKVTTPEIFRSRHGMEIQPKTSNIRSHDYLSHPKRDKRYGEDYEWGGAIVVDVLFGGVRYEMHVTTPELRVDNELGAQSREVYEKRKNRVRMEELRAYAGRLKSLLNR